VGQIKAEMKEKRMQKIIVLCTVATFIAASVRLAEAQQPKKVPRIGFVSPLVINLKTAKQIGLTIPPEVLARTNKLIK
jgi:hypothetical protein